MATNLSNTEVAKSIGLPADTMTKLATAQGADYQATKNEFLTAIVNKIVYQKVDKMEFTDPFKKFDSYPINYGDTIENIFTDLPAGYEYDQNATDPFAIPATNVKALYATLNYKQQYAIPVYDALLRRAALNEYGFMQVVSYMLDTLGMAKSVDEYTACIRMLNNANIFAGGIESLEHESTATPAEIYQQVTQKIIDVVTDFALPSKENNKLGVLNACPKSKCLLIIKQSILNHINIDFLSGVFNLSKVDLINNIIPVRSFITASKDASGTLTEVGEDIDFMIIDQSGFDNHVALNDNGMIYNPKGLYTNHYTNLWKLFSFKLYKNARAYKITTK